jgi:hypothetical protein
MSKGKEGSSLLSLLSSSQIAHPLHFAAKALNIASYDTPYVPGFDVDLLLGFKDASEATETYAWSKIQHLQYLVKCAVHSLSSSVFPLDLDTFAESLATSFLSSTSLTRR